MKAQSIQNIDLKRQLRLIQFLYFTNRLCRNIFRFLVVFLIALAGLLIAERFVNIEQVLRNKIITFLPYTIFLPLIFILIYCLKELFNIKKTALSLEKDSNYFDGYLVSSIQLEKDLLDPRLGYSPGMIKLLQSHVQSLLCGKRSIQLINWDQLRDSVFLFLTALMIYISCVGIAPTYFSYLYDQYIFPERNQSIVLATKFKVTPGSLSILTGKDLTINSVSLGQLPESVNLKYRYFGSDWETKPLKSKDGVNYHYQFINLFRSFEYQIDSKLASSEIYTVNVQHEPKILTQSVTYQYPEYTGLPNRTTTEIDAALEALYGTELSITATANKPVKKASLVFEKAKAQTITKIKKAELQTSFIATESDKYYLSIKDSDEFTNKNPVITPILVYPDKKPQITLIAPDSDVDLDESMKLRVIVKANDDFGIDRIELIAYRSSGEEVIVPIVEYTERILKTEEEYLWDLGSLLYFPGDQLTYRAAVWDNDGVKGSKRGLSERRRLRLPTMAEIYQDVNNEQKAQESGLQAILEQQRFIKEKASSLYDNLKREKNLNWAQKKELEEIAKRQQEIKKQMQKILSDMSESIKKMSDNKIIKYSTMEKMKQINSLLKDVLTSEMKEAMNKLNKAISNINLSDKQKELLQAKFNAEVFEKKVERTLKLLKQMKNKQELDSLISENKSIMEEQRRIQKDTMKLSKEKNQQMKDQMSKELGKREEKLAERLDELKKKMQDLAEKMKKDNPEAAKMLEEALKQMDQQKISDKMKEAAKSLKQQKPSKALMKQEQSLFGLFQFAKKIGSAGKAMEMEDQSELLSDLEVLINDTFYLSFQQETFIEKVDKTSSQPINELSKTELSRTAQQETNIIENSRKVMDKMQQIADKSPMFNYELVFLLSKTIEQMTQSVDQLEQKRVKPSLSLSKEALKSFNIIITSLMLQYRQLSDSSGGEGSGMSESLENMSERQEGINELTQMLSEKLMRGESLQPFEQEMLQQLAFEQSVMGDELRSVMEEMERLGQMLGRLSDAAKDSDEVSRHLGDKNLGKEILEKQRRILTRLLDAQQSQHRQDKEKRREAERPQEFTTAPSPPPISSPETILKKGLMPVSPSKNIPEPYKQLVQEYFRTLSTEN